MIKTLKHFRKIGKEHEIFFDKICTCIMYVNSKQSKICTWIMYVNKEQSKICTWIMFVNSKQSKNIVSKINNDDIFRRKKKLF